jgi:hypothetical protein
LPNEFELVSLTNFGESGPAAYSPYFESKCPDGCSVLVCGCDGSQGETWSSTTYAPEPTQAWYVDSTEGSALAKAKTALAHVRAVRLGN